MDVGAFIPSYQPLPFPLPVWLMQTLLVLGFYLHALPMNVVLGGGFLCAALFLLGRGNEASYAFRAARALAISLPLFISFAITQGIVPLLFLQLLYGPAFYTSSILMAVPWLALVLVVLMSYYVSYFVIYRVLYKEPNKGTAIRAALLLLLMSIGFAVIGYMFSSNMTLMLTPEKWASMYQASSHGLNMNADEAQLTPRYVHFFLASLAVAGMTLGCFGLYLLKRKEDFGRWLIQLGSRVFLVVTVLQIPVGIWFIMSIPAQFSLRFLGGDTFATSIFGLSMALVLASILSITVASIRGSKPAFIIALVTTAVLILAMSVNRHLLRLFYLTPHVKPESMQVVTQWDLLSIFLVSAVALIAYLIWLCRLVWSGYHSEATNSPG